ncbi:hypothetical protein KXD40_003089 [Peronospora effusa]|uniref:Uncharacterized protein n=1 Tax=Peronospora effusa TaxID=542832 RepID=A0A3M6VGI4_9STRA|nr:hypothetical protein DD238_001156 [Peronospora effusa]UIZ29266.1 hypothetical protein KXD40_003089 [Peronospora effusa]CAI5702722.1 unnamed protein product [Peronospora effusa]
MKVKGSANLMKVVVASLQCCFPILQMQKPLITRNTWALDGRSAFLHPSGYDFRQLSIVLATQQAKYYAGVSLPDTKKRYRYGALAVFDSKKTSPGHDDNLPMKKTLQVLQVCACEAAIAVDARKKEIEYKLSCRHL